MTPKQSKALAALLVQPTMEKAATAAGIGVSTLRRYLSDDEFRAEYERAVSGLVENAAMQAKQSLSPALLCLREIVQNDEETSTARIQAARSLLEYGLRLTEIADILTRLERAESDVL